MAAGKHDPTKADGANVSRREFIARSVAAGLVAATGQSFAATLDVVESEVTVKTPDGTCDAAFIHPASGAHPGVIIWPDAGGLRPSMRDIGKRIAAEGYSVLVPNPYYRTSPATSIDLNAKTFNFGNQDDMAKLRKYMSGLQA